jgi:Tfp pilus assembly protein PilX
VRSHRTPIEPDATTADGRCRGERGTALVTALVLLFAFTAGGVIWLSRDVNRRVSNRSAAQSIAFQAARTGAQQVEVGSLREGRVDVVVIDESEARRRASEVAQRLFDEYDVDGTVVSVAVAADTVTVEVRIIDTAGNVTGVGSARAESGP